jgi:hypothetical protein
VAVEEDADGEMMWTCDLLGYYAAYKGNSLSKFCNKLLVSSSSVKNSLPLSMGPIGCPETSVKNYQYTLLYIPEERRSHLLRGGSLKLGLIQDCLGKGGWIQVWRRSMLCRKRWEAVKSLLQLTREIRRREYHAGTCQHLGKQQNDNTHSADKPLQFGFHTRDIGMFQTYIMHFTFCCIVSRQNFQLCGTKSS